MLKIASKAKRYQPGVCESLVDYIKTNLDDLSNMDNLTMHDALILPGGILWVRISLDVFRDYNDEMSDLDFVTMVAKVLSKIHLRDGIEYHYNHIHNTILVCMELDE